MNWYYAIDNEQQGPVGTEEFYSLVDKGTITNNTLVWNKTMTDWQPFGDVKTDEAAPEKLPDQVVESHTDGKKSCSECGKFFPEDELANYNDALICAACKPAFLQKIREGVSIGRAVYGGFWIRFAAKCIDGIIIGVFNWVMNLAFAAVFMPKTAVAPDNFKAFIIPVVIVSLLQFAANTLYYVWFVGKYAATPGKMACGLRIITAENGRVSYLRAFGRMLAEFVSSLIFFIGYIMAAFDPEKRTLHDRMCSTRVVKK